MNPLVLFLRAFLFTLLYISVTYPQISWGINTFTGINFAYGSDIANESDVILGLDGNIEYTFAQDNREASFLLRAKPELLGFNNKLVSAKLKARGRYFQQEENFNWGINLTRQYNTFDGDYFNLHYDIFILNAQASLFFIDNAPVSLNLGYAYQITKDMVEQNIDLLFFDGKFFTRFGFLKIGYGIYVERFKILYEQREQPAFKNSNTGWRVGPQISLNYLKDYIFSAEYRFLFHDSPVTEYLSYDQWIRLLAGKFIFDDISVFILIDFYSRNYRLKDDTFDAQPIVYFPIDQENNFYFKVEYDWSEIFSTYIKTGYNKENFVVNNQSISGWNLLIGAEIGD